MIHIVKSSTGYEVVTVADNGEVLSASEILTSKQKCWTNIFSHYKQWGSTHGKVYVQDDTVDKPVLYELYKSWKGKMIKAVTVYFYTEPKYIPSTIKVKYKPKKK